MNDASLKEPLHPSPRRAAEELDPELVALPLPPRGRRFTTLAVMALAVAVALGLVSTLRHDIAYFFASSAPAHLGEASDVVPATLVSNSFAEVRGTPVLSQAVRYRRLLRGERFIVFPLAGQRTIFVHMPESALDAPRGSYAGRLVTFGQMGRRLEGVRGFFEEAMGAPVTSESYVLFVDESPRSEGWALALAGLCLLFIALDVWLLLRWFRPLPRAADDTNEGAEDEASA